ncbi:MAG: NADH-dependent [FeFe] hydrogenase, group A6 [Eubacteriales bacterium]|nr:NADH-dependent [FeFe] hydrogenase, group A6 [Eubacteriales bacterium]MDY2826414.1 NADH-dependent [FeFe] hydrogenase, group A6 [Eubacteriales bacterium]
METVNIKINGMEIAAPKGSTVLEAARKAGIDIPTLCYLKETNEIGACRICLVEVREVGRQGLSPARMVTACVYPITEGMEVVTNSPRITASRRMNLELLLSNHNKNCLSCIRSTTCELQRLCQEYGVDEDHFGGEKTESVVDDSSPAIIRDNSKCILCRRCVAACRNVQGIGVIGANHRGFDTAIGCAMDGKLADTSCINCGQCVVACPTGALHERDDTDKVFEALADPKKKVYICAAPSVRAQIGECFGYEPGTDCEGKMVAALRRLGFDGVFDMNVTADLTIVEEATELLSRVEKGGPLPLITSCSPGWIKYCEHYFPEMTENLSTCKSPQQMFGALMKTYFAKKEGIDPADIVMVSAIPCTAKKFEVGRPDQSAAGVPDVDIAVTTREVGRMIKRAGINFRALPDEKFDAPFSKGSGAGVIFGATGGVMEAALRFAAEVILGKKLVQVEFPEVRGTEGIKFASYRLGEMTVNVAVASGTKNAKELLRRVESGEVDVQFIEIMACPGGCVNGGGQPYQPASVRDTVDLRAVRAAVLYHADEAKDLRKSQDSSEVKALYDEFLGTPGGHKAHEILHTSYIKRGL